MISVYQESQKYYCPKDMNTGYSGGTTTNGETVAVSSFKADKARIHYYVREDQNAYKRRNIKRRLRGIKLRLIVSKRLRFSLKGNLMILKDIIAIFIPQKIFEVYYKRRLLKNNA